MGLWATEYREQQKLSITKILFLKEKKFSENNSEGLNLGSVCDFRDTHPPGSSLFLVEGGPWV